MNDIPSTHINTQFFFLVPLPATAGDYAGLSAVVGVKKILQVPSDDSTCESSQEGTPSDKRKRSPAGTMDREDLRVGVYVL